MNNNYTDPLVSLSENFFGKKKQEILDPNESMPDTKDVTPNPKTEGLNATITAYNELTVQQQMRFIEILLSHETEKVKEVMKKVKGF